MDNRTANNLNPHRVPNVAKYRSLANDPQTWARMVNHTRFDGPNGCWDWQGVRSTTGYGLLVNYELGPVLAHRLALHVVGRPVPVDMVVDHLCRNRLCVNPAHLEIVTSRENILRGEGTGAQNARKTHCVRGHAFDESNTGQTSRNGRTGRYCRACARDRSRHAAALARGVGGDSVCLM